jgi:hypothetical protein
MLTTDPSRQPESYLDRNILLGDLSFWDTDRASFPCRFGYQGARHAKTPDKARRFF